MLTALLCGVALGATFTDDFDDNDISDWTVEDGIWTVLDGILTGYSVSHTGPDLLVDPGFDADLDTWTVEVVMAGNSGMGMVIGWESSSAWCGFHLYGEGTLYLMNDSTEESEVTSVAYSSGTFYTVLAEVTPYNVGVYLDGSLVYSGDLGCTGFSPTHAGLGLHSGGTMDADTFTVEWQSPDADGDGYSDDDCDDDDASINPSAEEICDGVDNDCDGESDGSSAIDATTWGVDYDGDGYGGTLLTTTACESPGSLYVANTDDCDDLDADTWPGATETCDGADDDCDGTVDEDPIDPVTFYGDGDGDGFGDVGTQTTACDAPSEYVADDSDCDDGDPAVNPDASEVCDGVDNDCDGAVDEDGAEDAGTWYADGDGDGYGDPAEVSVACDAPSKYVAEGSDCDDGDSGVNPGATEVCDLVDNDCDGETDDPTAADATTWYTDSDGDGHGDPATGTVACWGSASQVATSDDCDDGDATISPDATEFCDGSDNDCDSDIDEDGAADAPTWYADSDGDGYGDAGASEVACSAPSATVADKTDCDDAHADVNPGSAETCDGVDNDCDGATDEATALDATTWYADNDGDGYGDPTAAEDACDAPSGAVDNALDCDDDNSSVNPASTELCDLVDNDCDGTVDEDGADAATWYGDADGDGYGDPGVLTESCYEPSDYTDNADDCDDSDGSVHPGATETWYDGVDADCAGDSDYDADADGHDADDQPRDDGSVGDDCDDEDATVNPDAAEIWYDGVDSDCAGDNDYDADGDGYDSASYDGDDCDDADPDTYPGAPDETGDGIVNDCDESDEYDADGDGWDLDEDCDDNNSSVNPDAEEVWYDGIDQDCDGNDTDQDGDGWSYEDDCDDTDASSYPGAPGLDEDCNDTSGDTGDTGWGDTGVSDTGVEGDKDGCDGCASGGGGGGLWFWALVVGLVRRRS